MDYIFGYGSLLSAYSRQTYSNIHSEVVSATITGWSRAWCAVYPDEGATYAGALRKSSSILDGVLIQTQIDDALSERERGYQFSLLSPSELIRVAGDHELRADDRIWICESLQPGTATELCPLPQSYVDTCLSGCIDAHGVDSAARFVDQTDGWNCIWVNDRDTQQTPIYPRNTRVSAKQSELIDSILEERDVLRFRQA